MSLKPRKKITERTLIDSGNYRVPRGQERIAREAGLEHIPLVISIAKKYYKVATDMGISREDLIQAGIVGLIEARKKFREDTGNQFSSLAVFYIKGCILKYLTEHRNSKTAIKNISVVVKALDLWDRKKAGEDISEDLEKASTQVRIQFNCIKSDAHAEELRERARFYTAQTRRIDNPKNLNSRVSRDKNITLQEVIPDERKSALEILESEQTKRRLITEVKKLPPNERYVIELRFLAEKPKTLEEIGELLNLSKERIRQIEAKALRKLKKRLLQEE